LRTEKQVLVLLNPYSGEKKSRLIANHTVVPILKTAKIKHTVIEFHDRMPISDAFFYNKINIKDFYGFNNLEKIFFLF
jgi:hypothetical protein